MKKSNIFVFSLFLLVTLFSPTPSQAILGNFLNFRSELKNEKINTKIETKSEVKLERRNQKLETKRTRAQAILKRLRQGIISRYKNTLKLKAKIEARLAKGNNTQAKAKFATFSDVKYKTDLAAFDAKTSLILTSDTPLKLTPELKVLAKSLQSDIKTMRQVLADTLRLIIKAR